MNQREKVGERRPSRQIKFRCRHKPYIATVGYYPDGRVAEVFFVTGRIGTDADIAARDLGLVTSLAIQHGCPVETIRHACLRDEHTGGLEGVLGAFFEALDEGGIRHG